MVAENLLSHTKSTDFFMGQGQALRRCCDPPFTSLVHAMGQVQAGQSQHSGTPAPCCPFPGWLCTEANPRPALGWLHLTAASGQEAQTQLFTELQGMNRARPP